MNKNGNGIIIKNELVEISEYKSNIEFGSKPIPDKLVVGKLPRNFNRLVFISKARKIFKRENVDYTTPDENFNFVLWFITKAKKVQKIKYIDHFVLAMRGIGLLVNEQKYWIKELKFKDDIINTLLFKTPVEDFYPEVLPLELFELVRRIPEFYNMRTWRNNIKNATTILALIYQSMRINYEYGKEIGNFSYTGLCTLTHISRTDVGYYLNLLEKYKIIVCIKHSVLKSETTDTEKQHLENNNYSIPLFNNIFHYYPLINVTQYYNQSINNIFPINISKVDDNNVFNIYDYSELIFGDKKKIIFIKDTFQRRNNSSYLFQKSGLNVFLCKENSYKTTDNFNPENWYVFTNSMAEIEMVKKIIESKASSINVDKIKIINHLNYLDKLKNDGDEVVKHSLGKLTQSINMLNAMQDAGIAREYKLCKTGRLKTSQYANPLNTSKDKNKYGFPFWDCIDEDLYEADIHAADVLSASMISGDKQMFDDYCTGEFYINIINKINVENNDTNRKLIKRIHLIIQNGGGAKNTYDKNVYGLIDKEGWEILFNKYKVNFNNCYIKYKIKSNGWKDKGKILKSRRLHESLPNELPLIIDKISAVPAHIIQSVTKIMISRLFIELEKLGKDCVFEIHDSVVMRNNIELDKANLLMRNIVSSILNELRLNWEIPASVNFVKVERLFSENKVA